MDDQFREPFMIYREIYILMYSDRYGHSGTHDFEEDDVSVSQLSSYDMNYWLDCDMMGLWCFVVMRLLLLFFLLSHFTSVAIQTSFQFNR